MTCDCGKKHKNKSDQAHSHSISTDWSKTIGFVNRAGVFSPSNERSEGKLRTVASGLFTADQVLAFNKEEFFHLRDIAKAHGFQFVVIQRGINR